MATVRKRTLPSGEIRWQASYVDGAGKRRAKLFKTKKDGEGWLVETRHDVVRGTHTPASMSPTVKDAAALWIKRCNEKGLEFTTVQSYEEHVDLHIVPLIGAKKLAEMTVPAVYAFADKLAEAGRSPAMIRRVVGSLGSIFKDAQRRGMASINPAAGLDLDLPERDDPRPEIPTKAELQAIINGAEGRWRPLILTAIFCGLRASELRGLRWVDVDFDGRQISINQRANSKNRIGKLKSKAAYRDIPCPPLVINALREWKLVCPKGEKGLVFPTGAGNVESHSNIVQRGFEPLQVAIGVATGEPVLDDAGRPIINNAGQPVIRDPVAKYGMHSLRHACASLWIEHGANPKRIQTLMGHSTIKMTFDVYGHLFKDLESDQQASADIQARLLGS